MPSLRHKVLFITGASRGIGLAIALRAARDGARIAIAAKTAEPHPKLPGTIHTAAEEIARAGGEPLPLAVDIRDEGQIARAVEATVQRWGGIDICVNNASAIGLTDTESTPMKRFDLMHQVNARGTFATTQACLPHLKKAANAHVLNISPPLNMKARWFAGHVAYTMAKYGMSMCVLGMAEEFRDAAVAVNALWPRTAIATVAMDMIGGGPEIRRQCRTVDIMADAAHAVLGRDARTCTGNFFIDDEVLRAEGVKDLTRYAVDPGAELLPDFFLD
ncbi:MAG TPA: NAD(P)-dependent oxidoreductase [Myxococcaceae bacterium]|jgi:citronellol/citronellal dehydrogenase|nr:NAD(P)-dependent oxidoreductase [Myxococcaceae bacterium]